MTTATPRVNVMTSIRLLEMAVDPDLPDTIPVKELVLQALVFLYEAREDLFK